MRPKVSSILTVNQVGRHGRHGVSRELRQYNVQEVLLGSLQICLVVVVVVVCLWGVCCLKAGYIVSSSLAVLLRCAGQIMVAAH